MKNKKKIIIVFAIFVVLLICIFNIFTFATNKANEKDKILTGEKLEDYLNTYKIISYESTLTNKLVNEKLKEYMTKIKGITNMEKSKLAEKIDQNEYKVNFYENSRYSRIEQVIQLENDIISINADSGELINYTQKVANLKNTSLTEEQIKEKALNVYKNIKLKDYEKFELKLIEKFDDQIWTAVFEKKYENLFNPGESIRISFSPETNEIANLAILNYKFDNNEIKISEKDAREIAENYTKKISFTEMTSEIQIVAPNYFWYKNNYEYKNICRLRKAYVFTCNNNSKTQIYVDCTTGEIIGGNETIGGAL